MKLFDALTSFNLTNLKDVSIKKRLLFGNLLMVLVPIFSMLILAAIFIGVIRYTHPVQEALKLNYQTRGESLSVQILLSSLQGDVDSSIPNKLERIRGTLESLEKFGITTAVVENGIVTRLSPGVEGTPTYSLLQEYINNSNPEEYHNHIRHDESNDASKLDDDDPQMQSYMVWDKHGIIFRYASHYDRIIVVGTGNTPFIIGQPNGPGAPPDEDFKNILDSGLIVIFGIGIIIIILLGINMTRMLSNQILKPLKTLQNASKRIREGNLDTPIESTTEDEFGDTIRAFESMRKDLKQAHEDQEVYEENQKELIAGISHDLATPITMIKGYASGLLDGVASTPERQRQYVKNIQDTSNQMDVLVKELFVFSKLDLGRLEFDLMPLNVYDYIHDFISDAGPVYEARGLRLSLLTPRITQKTKVDYNQFKRVITNIFENSLKYKNTEMGKLDVYISATSDIIKIKLVDHGQGVDPNDLSKLFESFYRTDKARTNAHNGSGLGLAIVKRIIEGMHGSIHAALTNGGGLTICIELPVIKE